MESRKAKLLESPPSWCPPDAKMAQLVRANAQAVSGIDPTPVISLGGTDARLWRYKDLPAIVYGPSPTGMGSTDEPQKRNTALFLPNGATTPRTRGDRDEVAGRSGFEPALSRVLVVDSPTHSENEDERR
jgi:hypothetical protein